MQKYNLQWHCAVKMSQNGDIFLTLEFGFFLEIGKETYFLQIGNMTQCHLEHDPISEL